MHKIQSKNTPLPSGPQYAGFVERLFYQALNSNLKTRKMSTVLNGRIVPLADTQRMVAHARACGWLPPENSRRSQPNTSQHGSILAPSTVAIFQIDIECSLSFPWCHLIVQL